MEPILRGRLCVWLAVSLGMVLVVAGCKPQAKPHHSGILDSDAREIAKEAYIYGFPLVDNYRIFYSYFVDRNNKEFKAPLNEIRNMPRVYTPDDKAVQTPNSDTPYSMAGLDLRAEPMVLTIPKIEKGRYFSVQMVDLNTFNFAYLGTRTTGNDGGVYLVTGPGWKGTAPKGVKQVIPCETELATMIYRTQVFGPNDLHNVVKIQTGYKVEPLSHFLGTAAPAAAVKIDFLKPLTAEEQKTSLDFYRELNFILEFCPTDPSEEDLMKRFGRINVGAERHFVPNHFPPETRQAISDGMADAWAEFAELRKKMDGGHPTSGELFGTRKFLNNNYLYRMAGAVTGIYGNSKEEAMYPFFSTDSNGKPLNGAEKYTLHFAAGQLPPVNAFWSLTMYEMPSSLLVANPIHRYLINSAMLGQLKRDANGGLTIYVQHDAPGPGKEANWLPAPSGTFVCVLRLYAPKAEAIDGKWKAPAMTVVE
jgi:hypothetical protein